MSRSSGFEPLTPRQSKLGRFRGYLRPSLATQALLCMAAFALGPMSTNTAAQPTQNAAEERVDFSILDSVQLATMLKTKDFFFVNVHIPYEGEIEGTDAHIAFDKIAENLDKIPSDKGARIVLYCQSGRMSEIAAGEFLRLGYGNVAHLSGGMIGWRATGNNIIK